MKKFLLAIAVIVGSALSAHSIFEVNSSGEGEWKYRLKDGLNQWIFTDRSYQIVFGNGESVKYVPFSSSDNVSLTETGQRYAYNVYSAVAVTKTTCVDGIAYHDLQNNVHLEFRIDNGKLLRKLYGSSQADEYIFICTVNAEMIFPPAGYGGDAAGCVRVLTPGGNMIHEFSAQRFFQTPEILASAERGSRDLRYHVPVTTQSGTFAVEWFTYLGANDSDDLLSIDDMPDGGVVLCGRTQSTTFPGMNAGDTLRGSYDMVIVRFDSSGQHMWTTVYGGLYYETANAISVNDTSIYVGGATNGNDVPMINAYQDSTTGSYDAIVLKLNFNGDIVQSTYFGSTGAEFIYGLDTDSTGRLVIGGSSTSPSLPQSAGNFQPNGAGAIDGFVCVMNDSFAPIWSTFYGGSGTEDVHQLSVSDAGTILLAGGSFSIDFPCTPNAVQAGRLGNCDAYLVVLDMNGNRKYATYYGGSMYEDCYGVAGDADGNVYMAGLTTSPDFNTAGVTIQSNYSGMNDAWIAKFDSTGAVRFSTFYGGADDDKTWSMDMRGKYLYVAGVSYSSDLMMNTTSPQDTMAGYSDGFVLKMDTAGNYVTSTYIGGNSADDILGITVNGDTMVTCTGVTYSTNLDVTPGAFQQSYIASGDGFVVRFHLSEELFSSESEEVLPATNDLSIFPIPAGNEEIIIAVPSGSIKQIRMFSATGALMYSNDNVQTNHSSINVSQFASGIYSVQCVLENGSVVSKPVIISERL
ncbi:MAG: T9SS type A sorting domain-containing protein [Bacteroidia bacterium]|nr:T9SS type A sorting domain-containing protein [Bacteroidia bacterium]